MRRMGIGSREQFVDPHRRVPNATMGRSHQRILIFAIAQDARVSAIESAFVLTTLAQCERREEPVPFPTRSRIPEDNNFPDVCWEKLDRIDLQDVYQSRFHVLQSCPHVVRGRFRQAVRRALEARSEAVRVQDAVGEVRGWLLRRSGDSQRVPKEELVSGTYEHLRTTIHSISFWRRSQVWHRPPSLQRSQQI